MAALELISRKQFERVILNGVSIVDFNAHWCGPCRAQDLIIDEINDTYKGKVTVAKLDIDENQPIAMDLGIQSIPTIIIFKEGQEIKRFIGLQEEKTLDNALKTVLM
ncbi:MAG: thioredoxin [Desulfobacteraceae bacterium]|jgi:thioredoxin 1